MSTPTRDRLHRLIDELPEQDLPTVEQLLTERRLDDDAFRRMLAEAPEDDEPLKAKDIAAIEEGLQDVAAGRLIPNDELWRRLGHAPTN